MSSASTETEESLSKVTSALINVSSEQVVATAKTMGLSAAQTATAMAAKSMKIEEIAAELATRGFSKATAEAALTQAGFSPELVKSTVAQHSFAAAEGTATAATNTFTVSLAAAAKGLAVFLVTNPVGQFVLLTGVILATAKAVDFFTESFDDALSKAEESSQAYEDQKSKIKSLEEEIESTGEKIDELESKGFPTPVEEEDLNNLRAENALLKEQLEIEKAIANYRGQKARDDANNALTKKDFQVAGDEGRNGFTMTAYKSVDIIDYTVDQQKRLNALTKDRNDLIHKQNGLLDENGDITDMSKYNQYQKRIESSDKQITELMGDIAGNWDTISKYRDSLLDENGQAISGYEDTVERIAQASTLILDSSEAVTQAIAKQSEASNFLSKGEFFDYIGAENSKLKERNGLLEEALGAIEYYNEVQEAIAAKNIDPEKTVFGNIDLNNRQVLEWTDSAISTYQKAIDSWGESADDLRGTISTVVGTWDEFDGVPIAFSPMLQTESGAVYLDADTVHKYIYGLIDKAGEGWKSEDLFRLDTEGLELDGITIKNLLADIGDTAESTAESMHFIGTDGAINDSYREISKVADALGVSVEELIQQYDAFNEEMVENDYLLKKNAVVQDAVAKGYTVTAEMIKKQFPELAQAAKDAGFDIEDVVNSINASIGAVNTDQLKNKLQDAFTVPTMGYEAIKDYVDAAANAQSEFNHVLLEGESISASAYERLLSFVGGKDEALKGFIDKSRGYLVTNTEMFHNFVDSIEDTAKSTLKLAKSQQELKYHELVAVLRETCDGMDRYDGAAMSVADTLLEQIDATELQIRQYKLLEQQLLGATSAFDKLKKAEETDAARDYTDELSAGISGLIKAFENHEFGTEYFKTAFDAFIPEDIYGKFADAGDQIDAGWDYLNTKLAKYFTFDNGNVSIGFENVKKFVKDGLNTAFGDSKVLVGNLENFDLNPQISTLKELAAAMGVTETAAFALGNAISKYTSDHADFLSKLSMDGSGLETQIMACDQKMAGLLKKQTELGKAGKVGTEDWKKLQQEIAAADQEMGELQKKARENILTSITIESDIVEKQAEVDALKASLEQLSEGSAAYNATLSNYEQAKDELDELIQKKYDLGEPTQIKIELALGLLDQLEQEINEAEAKIKTSLANRDLWGLQEQTAKLRELTKEKHDIEIYAGIANKDDLDKDLKYYKEFEIDDKKFKVTANTNEALDALDEILDKLKEIPANKKTTVTVYEKKVQQSGHGLSDSPKAGGSKYRGTAHAEGVWGTAKAEKDSLVGELGEEIVVDPRTGHWHTVGENGAEIVDLPKGSIVFNHLQTEQILKNRRINSRGKAYAWGSAHFSDFDNSKYKFGTLSNGSKIKYNNKIEANVTVDQDALEKAGEVAGETAAKGVDESDKKSDQEPEVKKTVEIKLPHVDALYDDFYETGEKSGEAFSDGFNSVQGELDKGLLKRAGEINKNLELTKLAGYLDKINQEVQTGQIEHRSYSMDDVRNSVIHHTEPVIPSKIDAEAYLKEFYDRFYTGGQNAGQQFAEGFSSVSDRAKAAVGAYRDVTDDFFTFFTEKVSAENLTLEDQLKLLEEFAKTVPAYQYGVQTENAKYKTSLSGLPEDRSYAITAGYDEVAYNRLGGAIKAVQKQIRQQYTHKETVEEFNALVAKMAKSGGMSLEDQAEGLKYLLTRYDKNSETYKDILKEYKRVNKELKTQNNQWVSGSGRYDPDYLKENYLGGGANGQDDLIQQMKQLLDDGLSYAQGRIDLMGYKGEPPEKSIQMYRRMQEAVHQQAEMYREMGIAENSKYIQELQLQWWEYEKNIQGVIEDSYSKQIQAQENAIKLNEDWMKNNIESGNFAGVAEHADAMIDHYRKEQALLHEQAEYYRNELGLSDVSDEVSGLMDSFWQIDQKIKEVKTNVVNNLHDMVDAASGLVDEIQNVYNTLKTAAREFEENGGLISVDTYQDIIALGPQYMQYLRDENGLLVINEESIQKVIAARVQQLALENALTYVERLRLARQEGAVESLNELLYATVEATDATWGMVYANLALIGLTDDEYEAARHNIDAFRSIADAAVDGIGREIGSIKGGYDSILEYVMDMIKQKIQDQIDALEDMKDAYGEVIDQKKDALELADREAKSEKNRAAKLREIAKLQAKIDALSLDDSRSAQAERAKLIEELTELQDDLNETQSDKALEATKDALDDMKDAYDEEKDGEIKKLQDSVSSQQKLYEMAVDHIRHYWETNWDELKEELLQWNYDVGSSLQSEIETAWDNCTQYIQNNPLGLDGIFSGEGSSSGAAGAGNVVGSTGKYDDEANQYSQVAGIIAKMKENSRRWGAIKPGSPSAENDRMVYSAANRGYANQIAQITGRKLDIDKNGMWYFTDTGEKLYKEYGGKYHTGGFAGKPAMKPNERYVKVEDGELILTSEQQDSLIAKIERVNMLSKAFESAVLDMPVTARSMWPDGFNAGGGSVSNITNNRPVNITMEGATITCVPEKSVEAHRKVDRDMMNQIGNFLRRG